MRRLLASSLLLACTPTTPAETPQDESTATSTSEPTSTGTSSDTTQAPTTTTETTGEQPLDYNEQGPHPVGNTRFTLSVGDRDLLVELWYPADPSAGEEALYGRPIEDFVPAGPDHDAFVTLLETLSPAGQIGTRLQTSSAFSAPPADGTFPLVLFSHCHNCVRFSAFTVAERLASHGFVVAAPDHTGNTLFDQLNNMSADIGEEFLLIRLGDMQSLLDALLKSDPAVPALVQNIFDPTKVGVFGHSYGAATAGRLAQEDPRILAAMPIAAPVENPIFPNTHVADIHVPMLSVLAEEDNSIQKIGNNLIKSNFEAANPPVRLVSVADAGHWNFTDICGLTDAFAAGCGDGERQSEPGVAFTYLDIAVGREIAASYALAFFDSTLRNNPDAATFLDAATPTDVVTVDVRE